MKRFSLHTHDDSRVICAEDENGEWVKREDVIAVLSEIVARLDNCDYDYLLEYTNANLKVLTK